MELNRQSFPITLSFTSPTSPTAATTTSTYSHTTVAISTDKVVNTTDAYSLGVCPSGHYDLQRVTINYS